MFMAGRQSFNGSRRQVDVRRRFLLSHVKADGSELDDGTGRILSGSRYLLHDRDSTFSAGFDPILKLVGVNTGAVTAAQSKFKCLFQTLDPLGQK